MRRFKLYIMRGDLRDSATDTQEILTFSALPRIGETIYFGDVLKVVAVNWLPIGHAVDVEVVAREIRDPLIGRDLYAMYREPKP